MLAIPKLTVLRVRSKLEECGSDQSLVAYLTHGDFTAADMAPNGIGDNGKTNFEY
jgi:hypothetical protein